MNCSNNNSYYDEALDFLDKLQFFGIKLGLHQTVELIGHLNIPYKELKFIHVAGTNGKGSVCAMLDSCLRCTGFKTGLFTSPHLVDVRERIRINGKAISRKEFAHGINTLRPFAEKMKNKGECPTYFEFITALAIYLFYKNSVDFVIWETGMGGRFDATNIVTPICSVITSISLDHQMFLGNTLEDIAKEKAGIIKPGVPVFCADIKNSEVRNVIRSVADVNNSKCLFIDNSSFYQRIEWIARFPFQTFLLEEYKVSLSLQGNVQVENFFLSFEVLKFLSEIYKFLLFSSLQGLKNLKWYGRFQILPDGNIIDGAHNPDGIKALCDFLKTNFPNEKFSIVFANFADKNAKANIKELVCFAKTFVFVPVSSGKKRNYTPEELKGILADILKDNDSTLINSFDEIPIKVEICGSAKEALHLQTNSRKLFTGSLYLAGEILKEYYPIDKIINLS